MNICTDGDATRRQVVNQISSHYVAEESEKPTVSSLPFVEKNCVLGKNLEVSFDPKHLA